MPTEKSGGSEVPPLTIRNLTSTPVELKLIERFDALNDGRSIANITRSHKSVKSVKTKAPTAAQLAANLDTFSNEPLSIRIEPFETYKTNVDVRGKSKNQILRYIFESDGERHRLDALTTMNGSATLQPLTINPRYKYTAIYLAEHSFIALFSSANLNCWMRELNDETPLSALSIPGSHNTPTCHKALPSVRCQAHSPKTQLENGVRFFDIRVQPESPNKPEKDGLILVHSAFAISLKGNYYFRPLIKDVLAFLERNPSETVIMSIKREGTGYGTDAQLGQILHRHYTRDTKRWFTEPRIPTLGEARGKVVVMRRFYIDNDLKKEWNGKGWCIDAEIWTDNTPNDTCPSGHICVQDFYEVLASENIDRKIEYAEAQFERAARCRCDLNGINVQDMASTSWPPFYVNFLSASNFWRTGCWPERIAAKLNPVTVEFLCMKHNQSADSENPKELGDGSTGIVVGDWLGNNGNWDLVRCVIGWNARLEVREKEPRNSPVRGMSGREH